MLAGTDIEEALRTYEGLIKKTALMIYNREPPYDGGLPIEIDLEDIEQLLTIKVWKAVESFDPMRWKGGQKVRHAGHAGKSARDRYVNMCLRDQAKDIVKRRRRGESYIEDVAPQERMLVENQSGGGARDRFDERYLSVSHEQVYGRVEEEPPSIPDTLTGREKAILLLMYRNYRQTEVAEILEISKREVESSVRQLRAKLLDWPASPEPDPQQGSDERSAPEASLASER